MSKTLRENNPPSAEVRAGARLHREIELPGFTDALQTAGNDKSGGLLI